MRDRKPKLASLSVTVLAVAMVQAGAILGAVAELVAEGEPRLDRYLMRLAPLGVIWMLVAAVDLVAFPTMRMTRLLIGPAAEIAVIVTLVTTVMTLAFDLIGETFAIGTLLTDAGLSFVFMWGAVSLWKLGREWVRGSRTSVAERHSTSAQQSQPGRG